MLGVFPGVQKSDSLELEFQAMASHPPPPIGTENGTTHATALVQRPQESKPKLIPSYHIGPKD